MSELPTIITNDIFLLAVFALAAAPLFAMYGTFRIGRVYRSDTDRPRNRLLGRMFWSGASISVAGLYVTALSVGYIVSFFAGQAGDADFGGLTFALALITVLIQPYLNWLALNSLNGEVVLDHGPETQNQREDRQFGTERRLLEVEHNKSGETQNQLDDRVAGDEKRASENEVLDKR